MYDLNLFPIKTEQGRAETQSAGFLAVGPPRRTARSRTEDQIIFSLFLQGDDTLSAELQRSWLHGLSQTFFKTSGSVTSALRTLIEALNLTLMEKNLKLAKDGGGIRATINLAVVHLRSLFIVQSGYINAYVLTPLGLHHFYDATGSDRGLGFSRSPSIRYYQADLLDTGGYLFLTDTPQKTWTEEVLNRGAFPDLEQLRRRLLNQAPTTFKLDLVEIKTGSGKIQLHVPKPKMELASEKPFTEVEEEISLPEEEEKEIGVEPIEEVVSDTQQIQAVPPQDADQEIAELISEVIEDEIQIEEEVSEPPKQPPTRETSGGGEVVQQEHPVEVDEEIAGEEEAPPVKMRPQKPKKAFRHKAKQFREEGLQGMAVVFDWWEQAREKVRGFFNDLFVRLSPDAKGESLRLSKGTLLFIAVAVPIVVVTIAVSVYLVRGRTLQYQDYLGQAVSASDNAKLVSDPSVARDLWSQTLVFLNNAEEFKKTDEIIELRKESQDAMDLLDGAVRLAYQPAISGVLYSEINIVRIISYGMDLYLFDKAGGRVIHATRAQQGYEVDPEFICSAGAYSTGTVGALLDMVSLPINNTYQAHLLGVDANGNVAYCAPGMDPVVQPLPLIGDGFGEGVRIAYEYNRLYVLDPRNARIQIFSSTDGQFLDPSDNFFEDARAEEVPDFTKIVDMAVNGPELYLLRGDGKMVDCVYSGLPDNPVTCEHPVTYIDGRAGREDQTLVMPESNYVSVLYTSPPDPSINLLDADNADIYRFSLRFRAYQRLRPDLGDFEVDSPTATAFTIGIDQIAFIAFGNQVFYAYVE